MNLQMSTELDELVCKFAGLEPLNKRALAVCERANWLCVPEWPPVSTSWEAAGLLVDALAVNDIRWGRFGNGSVHIYKPGGVRCEARADSFPMALCLAVKALAEASK